MPTKFENLLADVKACQLCKDSLPLSPNPVLQVHPQARLLVVGQAPGKKVHETSLAFNDASGVRLRQWMAINRETFYNSRQIAIVPMGFCYPGTGKSGDLPPRPECSVTWHGRILEQLPNIKLVLVIGLYAQKYYLGSRCGKNLTGTVHDWEHYLPDYLPLPHPSPRNNIWLSKNSWFEQQVLPVLQQRVQEVLR